MDIFFDATKIRVQVLINLCPLQSNTQDHLPCHQYAIKGLLIYFSVRLYFYTNKYSGHMFVMTITNEIIYSVAIVALSMLAFFLDVYSKVEQEIEKVYAHITLAPKVEVIFYV